MNAILSVGVTLWMLFGGAESLEVSGTIRAAKTRARLRGLIPALGFNPIKMGMGGGGIGSIKSVAVWGDSPPTLAPYSREDDDAKKIWALLDKAREAHNSTKQELRQKEDELFESNMQNRRLWFVSIFLGVLLVAAIVALLWPKRKVVVESPPEPPVERDVIVVVLQRQPIRLLAQPNIIRAIGDGETRS